MANTAEDPNLTFALVWHLLDAERNYHATSSILAAAYRQQRTIIGKELVSTSAECAIERLEANKAAANAPARLEMDRRRLVVRLAPFLSEDNVLALCIEYPNSVALLTALGNHPNEVSDGIKQMRREARSANRASA